MFDEKSDNLTAAQRETSVAPPQEVLCSLCDKPANSFTLLCDYCDPRSSINSPYAEASVAEQPTPQRNEILEEAANVALGWRTIKCYWDPSHGKEVTLCHEEIAAAIRALKSGAGR